MPTLLERLHPLLVSLASSFAIAGYETDDLLQECVLRCLQAEPLYDAAKGAESTYYWTCCRRRLIDLARAASRDALAHADTMADDETDAIVDLLPSPDSQPDEIVMEAAAHDALQAACAALLSPDDVLILHNQQDGVPDHVTARTLGIRREAVCRRRASILAHLRDHLTPEDYL